MAPLPCDLAASLSRPGRRQVVALGGGEILEPVGTAARRLEQAQVPGALERRRQEEIPGRGRQAGDPRGEQLLQALAERQHRRQRLRRRALRIAQRLRQLQQGQRIALRHAQHPAPDQGIQAGEPRGYQLGGRRVVQRHQLVFREPGAVKVAVRAGPAGDQEPRPAAGQPPGHEAQHAGAGPVYPGQVIHDQQQRGARRRALQEDQHGVAHQQPVRRRSGAEPKGHSQRVPVGGAELVDVTKHREQDLVEPGEADLPLELSPGHAQHHGPRRGSGPGQGVQQRRLAHAGIPGQDERSAARRSLAEELQQEPEVAIPADQPASGLPSHLPALLIRWHLQNQHTDGVDPDAGTGSSGKRARPVPWSS
jgi:hypothetical protein